MKCILILCFNELIRNLVIRESSNKNHYVGLGITVRPIEPVAFWLADKLNFLPVILCPSGVSPFDYPPLSVSPSLSRSFVKRRLHRDMFRSRCS